MSEHLWEYEHDFYGPEFDYFATDSDISATIDEHDSWPDFVENGMRNSPDGLNLLYRWDWHAWHLKYPEDSEDGQDNHVVEFFWMLPRKGIMRRSHIQVTEADEAAVREFLESHAKYMKNLWAPLIP